MSEQQPSSRRNGQVSGFPTEVSGFLVDDSSRSSTRKSSDNVPTRENSSRKLSGLPERSKQDKFAFVYHTGPTVRDRESKRLIKKHVMKDIGKSRRKPPSTRKKAREATTGQATQFDDLQQQNLERDNDNGELSLIVQDPGPVSRFSTTRDPFIVKHYPIKVNRRTCALIDHLFSEAYPELKNLRDSFFPVGLMDAAAFHQVLAVLAIHLPFNRSKELNKSMDYETTEIVLHHAEAIKMLNTRMQDVHAATSDGTIGTIVLMVCHSYMQEDFNMWRAHMRGMKHLLKIRKANASLGGTEDGGCGSLSLSPALRMTLEWVDSTGSLAQDTPPVFPFPSHLVPFHPVFPPTIHLPPYLYVVQTALASTFSNLSLICDLFMDIAKLSALADAGARSNSSFWMGESSISWGATFLEPVTYRLLALQDRVNPLDTSSILQETMRLSLLIYLGPIRRKFGIFIMKMMIQLGKLLAVLRESIDLGVELNGLILWIVTIGAMEASETTLQDQFDSILNELLLDLGIIPSSAWEKRLQDLMWVEDVHGARFQSLWRRLKREP